LEISRHLESATAVVALISPASIESGSVQDEWEHALKSSSRIIPVRVAWAGVYVDPPDDLRDIQWIDLSDDYERALTRIERAVRRLNKSPEPSASKVLDTDKIVAEITEKIYTRLGISAEDTSGGNDLKPTDLDPKSIFVITSFDPAMEPIYEAIVAAASSVGLRAERVKDVPGDYRVTDKMLRMIRSARFVVADLTFERPNVYFELGYARGLNKTVITILREGTPAHFDVQDWTYMKYIDSRPLERDLRERFEWEMQQ
jgi:hypothetical protein